MKTANYYTLLNQYRLLLRDARYYSASAGKVLSDVGLYKQLSEDGTLDMMQTMAEASIERARVLNIGLMVLEPL